MPSTRATILSLQKDHKDHKKMRQTTEGCRDLLKRLRRGELSSRETVHALNVFGEEGFTEALEDVAPLLDSEDSEIRRFALSTLVRDWRLPRFQKAAEQLLLDDPDDLVRIDAAAALGAMGRSKRDRSILGLLYKVLMNGREDEFVRLMAYEAILDALGRGRGRSRPTRLSEIRDWALIDELRRELGTTD